MFSCPPEVKSNSPRGHASEVLRNRENPKILEFLSKLQTDKNCPTEKSWLKHVKNEQHIGSEKITVLKNTGQFKDYSADYPASRPTDYPKEATIFSLKG